MIQQEKSLLLKDLCARLPYGVKIKEEYGDIIDVNLYNAHIEHLIDRISIGLDKLILRPMSSMTEEERKELLNLLFDKEAKYFYIDEKGVIDGKTSDLMKEGLNYPTFCPVNIELYTDWLNSRHFDYRGLLERGLALETPEGMYNIKEK